MDDLENPMLLRVHLKRSKCDQLGKGIDVFVGCVKDPHLCPVTACSSYMAYQGPSPGPFFRYESGGPLTKARFVSAIKSILTQAGMEDSLYSGHSFCIGATTTAAQAGIADSVIKALGRWSNAAFLVYVRAPRAQLAQYS